jgi:UDP-galactopyranose mutase
MLPLRRLWRLFYIRRESIDSQLFEVPLWVIKKHYVFGGQLAKYRYYDMRAVYGAEML